MENPLGKKAMLIRLSIHSWSGKKIDNNAAKAAATQLGMEAGTDEYYKYLVPKTALYPIKNLVSEIRAFHAWETFPWFDNGLRVLPATNFFNYRNRLDRYKGVFDTAVSDFISQYPSYKAFSEANRKAVFNPLDYPPEQELRALFKIETNVMPIPEHDFRLEVPPDVLEELKNKFTADQNAILEQNEGELRNTLRTRLHAMASMCQRQTKLYGSTVQLLHDTVAMVKGLNVRRNPMLDTACLACVEMPKSVDSLKDDPEMCERTARACKDILEILI